MPKSYRQCRIVPDSTFSRALSNPVLNDFLMGLFSLPLGDSLIGIPLEIFFLIFSLHFPLLNVLLLLLCIYLLLPSELGALVFKGLMKTSSTSLIMKVRSDTWLAD